MKRALGQGDITITIAFAGADVHEHPLGIDVFDLQAQALPQSQATRVYCGQGRAVIRQFHLREDETDFGTGEDDGKFELGIGADQFDLGGPGAAQGFFPEELEGADGLGGGLAGDFLVALQEDEVLAQFLGGYGLRGLMIMIGELARAVPISVAGAVADGAEFEVVGEGD